MDPAVPPFAEVGPWRRRVEALGVSLLGGVLFYTGVRFHVVAPAVLPAAYAVLMAPAVVRRWRAPLTGFMPGLMLAAFALWHPLANLSWYAWIFPPLMTNALWSVQPLMAAGLRRTTDLPAMVIVPLSVGAGEWIRPLICFADFNMFQIGPFMHPTPILLQSADLVGALGLSVLWSLPWAILLDAVRWRIDGVSGSPRRLLMRGTLLFAALNVAALAYGAWRLADDRSVPGPRIAIVQPDVPHTREQLPEAVAVQERMTRTLENESADLVVWPENALFDVFSRSRHRSTIERLAADLGTPLLLGAQESGAQTGGWTNSSLLIDPGGRIVGRNDKIVLFPFSERRPFPWLERLFPPLRRFITRLTEASWGSAPAGIPGKRPELMAVATGEGSWSFWTPICYEVCYAGIARDATRRGARFLVNMTAEGWLGWGLNNNQMAVSMARAVENRVGVVRVGNTGISCFIRPDGRVERFLVGEQGRLLHDRGVLVHRVRVDPRAPTLYSRYGDALDLVWPGTWLVLVLLGIVRRRRR